MPVGVIIQWTMDKEQNNKPDSTDTQSVASAETQNRLFQDANLNIRAAFNPTTFNAEARTVEISFASETPVRRNTWDGTVNEVLSFDAGAVRLERLNSGANVLDNHDRWGSVSDVVGVVERAWIADRRGYALVRFAKNENGDKVMGMVADGILRSISVGYAVYAYQKTENENGPDTWRAIDWEPFELSFVSVPADATAQVRSQQGDNNIISPQQQQRIMDEVTTGTEQTPAPQPVTSPTTPPPAQPAQAEAQVTEAERAAIALAERARVAAIYRNVETAGLERTVADELINAGHTVERAAAEILTRMGQRVPPVKNQVPDAHLRGDGEVEKRRQAMQGALLLRFDSNTKLPEQQATLAREYRGVGLRDMARVCLEDAGVSTRGLSPLEIVGRAFTQSTSDFPVILEGILRQTLLDSYGNVADTWSQFCRRGSVSDFRQYKRKRTGALPSLPVVPESGEYTTSAIPDGESNALYAETYGSMINVSRQMIVNDDLGAFLQLPRDLGRAAARTIEEKVYAVLLANPTMADGYALFSTEHVNLVGSGSGGVITVATVDALRLKLLNQRDPNLKEYLGIQPYVLLCGTAQGGQARVVNESQYDVDQSNKTSFYPNKVRGLFTQVVESPRISGNAWYIFANPADHPVLEVAFLDGVSAPYMEMKDGWNVDGTEWKVRLDFGVGVIGFRGAAFNYGS